MRKTASGISPVLAIDRTSTQPLTRQIYEGFRNAIANGTIRPGQRVPSTRTLASELGVSRIPALNAYAQLLSEGYFESRVGAGTIISHSMPDQVVLTRPRPAIGRLSPRPIARDVNALPSIDVILPWLRSQRWGAFNVGQPALDQLPIQTWSRLLIRHARKIPANTLSYGDPMGLRELREAIAEYLATARGVRCDASQIMIVSGSQQALQIATQVLLNRGDQVWIEEPGYRFARYLFALHGCRVVPVTVDYEGLNVKAGVKRAPKARLALVTPSHQYPLGVTMSATRRFQLLEWAQKSGAWIVEDDYDSEYRYESLPVASLQGLDNSSRVIYIGTFSKVLFPSLRIGYIVIPADLVERFLTVRFATDIAPPHFCQAVLADFIREGHFARHLRRMRLLYSERRRVLVESIRKELGFAVDITGAQAGIHLALTLTRGVSDVEISKRAAARKLWLPPLSPYYCGTPTRTGMILGFGSTPVLQSPRAIRKLRELLK